MSDHDRSSPAPSDTAATPPRQPHRHPPGRSRRRVAALGLAGLVGLGALAAFGSAGAHGGEGRCGARGPGAAMGPAFMMEAAPGLRDPERLAQALKLTEAQRPAWNAYVATLNAAAAPMPAPAAPALTAPQRLEQALAAQQAREALARQRLEAMQTLHAQLSAEQRAEFDSTRGWRGRGGWGH